MISCGIPAVVLASVLATASSGTEPAVGAGRIPEIKFEKYTLPNELDVILHEDHSTPIVSVNIWYHVGSKNERRGRTGFAHLFEHMMFQGSQHHDNEYFAPLQQAGGRLNGSTNDDRTNYWEVMPSNYLELALWLESDRMGYLLPAMTQDKLDNQRDVVKNERRQSYENRPYGLAGETIAAAMYPPDHPYSWPTIGSMEDLSAASREDISQFFRRYYHATNASLCIAGDFDPVQARRLVQTYFGTLPAGKKVEKMRPWVPELAGEMRLKMEDRVSLPRLYLNWHTPPSFAPDDAELDLLASVLGASKSSRLYRSLVHEKQLAQDVTVIQGSGEIAGTFRIVATARPGKSLAELEAAILEEIARIRSEPPKPEELERVVNQYEASYVSSLESVGGFGGRADRLNHYNVMTGDPGFMTKDFERYLHVTPRDVQRVAKAYLTDRRVILQIVPGNTRSVTPDPFAVTAAAIKQLAESAKAEIAGSSVLIPGDSKDAFDRSVMPPPNLPPKFQLPSIHRSKLSNGLELLVVERHELPTVSFNLLVRSGSAANPPDKLGLAGIAAAMLDEGTEKRSATEIADQLAAVGSSLSVNAGWDTSNVRLFTLKRHLAHSLDIYSDILLHPSFPGEELGRQRSLALGRLTRLRDDPTALATLAVGALLYGPDHPYGRTDAGNESSLRAITRDDLVRYYRSHFLPNHCSLIVVGDITSGEIVQQLESALTEWRPGTADSLALPNPPPAAPTGITIVDKPGAAQSVISVSQLAVLRNSPDYFPLLVMNTILGGQFSSRLNMNLREDKGYTYGARSSFDWRQQPGPYEARASVQTAVTAPALVEFLKEFRGIAGDRPIDQKELEFAKAYITRGYPTDFETPRQIAGRIEDLVEFELPDNYFNTFVAKVSTVSTEDVMRVAKKYVDIDHLTVTIVGDRSQIESSLRDLTDSKKLSLRKFDEHFRLAPAE